MSKWGITEEPGVVRIRRAPNHELIRPEIQRSIEGVDSDLQNVFRNLMQGYIRWPLYLWSKAGRGKTYAVLAFSEFCWCMYFTLEELCEAVIAARSGQLLLHEEDRVETSAPELWKRWSQIDVALLDEVGRRDSVSDHEVKVLQRALDIREQRPLIVCSNLPPGRIARLYDDRIGSRCIAGTVWELKGPDRRVRC